MIRNIASVHAQISSPVGYRTLSKDEIKRLELNGNECISNSFWKDIYLSKSPQESSSELDLFLIFFDLS